MNWLPLARLWTRHAPVARGKDRLATLALRLTPAPPADVCVETVDGRRFRIDPASHGYAPVYFRGVYEPGISHVVSRLLRPGDVCLDVGAHIGWYTTLAATLVGPTGAVHAFEPLPSAFRRLERNVALLQDSSCVVLNNIALGEAPGAGLLHVFPSEPDSHSSISDQGRPDARAIPCTVTTLDAYLAERVPHARTVALVKLDVEGAELMCLRGAHGLFSRPAPPCWIVEMAASTSRGFGYTPNDLLAQIRARGEYDFFTIGPIDGALTRLEAFEPGDPGDYVLCAPRGRLGASQVRAR
ncbi:MAG: FkbM family methyltransferase [Vicinamibacterales bacterium]